MTIYRVGRDGATVFGPDGRRIAYLSTGTMILPGSSSEPGDLSSRTVEVIEKRVRHYSDKRVSPSEDK
jgi:hypothetical protein